MLMLKGSLRLSASENFKSENLSYQKYKMSSSSNANFIKIFRILGNNILIYEQRKKVVGEKWGCDGLRVALESCASAGNLGDVEGAPWHL